MEKKSQARYSIARLVPEIMDPRWALLVRVAPSNVHMFTNIMEGFSHLAWVTTYNAEESTLAVIATQDTLEDVRRILAAPPCSDMVEIVENR